MESGRSTCPRCERAQDAGAIARVGVGDMIRASSEDLDRQSLARSLEREGYLEAPGEQLDVARDRLDLHQMLETLDRRMDLPSLDEVEQALGADIGGEMTWSGVPVEALLSDSAEARRLLRTGLKFLKFKKYSQALEWWEGQARAIGAAHGTLQLLMWIMTALTYQLSGDRARAVQAYRRVRTHPSYASVAVHGLDRSDR